MNSEKEKALLIEIGEGADGRLMTTLIFGKARSARLRVALGDAWQLALKRALRAAVSNAGGASKRIVAHVPKDLAARFGALCKRQGVTKSRALLGRVSRYVNSEGTILKTVYRKLPPLPPVSERREKQILQIMASGDQVDGFAAFCKVAGIQKDTFMMREMLSAIEKAEKTAAKTKASRMG